MNHAQETQANPWKTFVFLILVGITSFFMILCVAYTYYSIETEFKPVKLPVIFHANTVIILLSSYTFRQSVLAIRNENSEAYYRNLMLTYGLGIAFIIFQILGWTELFRDGVGMSSKVYGNDGGYLIMISSMHILHILAGLVPMSVAVFRARKRKKDPVKKLLYDSNPDNQYKIKLLEFYWHFIDGLWVYLYLFFLVNLYLL